MLQELPAIGAAVERVEGMAVAVRLLWLGGEGARGGGYTRGQSGEWERGSGEVLKQCKTMPCKAVLRADLPACGPKAAAARTKRLGAAAGSVGLLEKAFMQHMRAITCAT